MSINFNQWPTRKGGHLNYEEKKMMYSPKEYSSIEELQAASILDAHSDTMIDGISIFGYVNGVPYQEVFTKTEDDDWYTIAGCCPLD